ncbi:MAG: hypothetical protein K2Y32_21365 [Candidatus Obscuribacterales bacterium]|nr:hypothetical protein [Candidatus Obscuribacterales bacterium]
MDRFERDKPAENATADAFAPTNEELVNCREMMKYDFRPPKELDNSTMVYTANGDGKGAVTEETRIDGLRLPDQAKDDPSSYTFINSVNHRDPDVQTAIFKRNQDGQLEPVTDEDTKAVIYELATYRMNMEALQDAHRQCQNTLIDAGEDPSKYLPQLDLDQMTEDESVRYYDNTVYPPNYGDSQSVPYYDNTILPPNSGDAQSVPYYDNTILPPNSGDTQSVPYYDNTVYPPNSGDAQSVPYYDNTILPPNSGDAQSVPYYDNTVYPPAATGSKKSGRPSW